jgi:hypothetical protein
MLFFLFINPSPYFLGADFGPYSSQSFAKKKEKKKKPLQAHF